MIKLDGKEFYPFYQKVNPELFKKASILRRNMTEAEAILWRELRNRQLLGYKFRRKHPFCDMILDFFCYDAYLSIQIIEEVQEDPLQEEKDLERTKIFNKCGIVELKFTSEEIENDSYNVVQKILDFLQEHTIFSDDDDD